MMKRQKLLVLAAALLAGPWCVSARAQTADGGNTRWMINLAGSGVFFPDLSAKVFLAGSQVPGASLTVPSQGTPSFDVGYFITPSLAIDVFAGVPPKTQILGTGPLAPLGTLATTYYGPGVLAIQYYVPGLGPIHPYVGTGVNWTFFLGTTDRALTHVQPADAFGLPFEAGIHYDVTRRWTFNIDFKYILLHNRISAAFDTPVGALPALAKADINPLVMSIGVGYRF
jgi:outer membrane protein